MLTNPLPRNTAAEPRRKSRTDSLLEAEEQRKRNARTNFANEWRENWLEYSAVLFSALFTIIFGLYLGLAPDKPKTEWWDWLVSIFFGLLYATAFPVLTQGAYLYWRGKLMNREHDELKGDNTTQHITALAMVVLSVAFMLTTDVTAAIFILHFIGELTVVADVPAWAQFWTVVALPLPVILNAVMNQVYRQASRLEIARRLLRVRQEKARVDSHIAILDAQTNAEIARGEAEADTLARHAYQGAPLLGAQQGTKRWKDYEQQQGFSDNGEQEKTANRYQQTANTPRHDEDPTKADGRN